MMKFNMIKPFVMEFITFVLVISGIFAALLTGNFIEVIFHMHLLTAVAIILVFITLISLFSRIVNMGVKALFDFVFQSTIEDNYVFLKEQPYKASVFTEKFGHDTSSSLGMYYLIQVKKSDEIYTFISPTYVELFEGKTYIIRTGRSSHIFLNSDPVEQKTGDGSVS